MADKHILALDVLRQYSVDLSVPHEVEFSIVSTAPIDEGLVAEFAANNGFHHSVTKVDDDFYMADLTTKMVITETAVRPLSEFVERFSMENGWDYQGWGASSFK
jgi:hypothetical protein